MNPVLESLFKHKSIRKYKNQPLEDEKLQLIIKAAQAAPTWCNGQQVSIIVVKDQALRDKIKECCWGQEYISTCSVFLVFCADFYRVSIGFEKAGKTKEDFEKYVTNIDTLIIGSHDVGIAIQNATVAAESMGLGTVDIGAIRIKSLEVTKYVLDILIQILKLNQDSLLILYALKINMILKKPRLELTNMMKHLKIIYLVEALILEIVIGVKVFLIFIVDLIFQQKILNY